MASMHLWLGVFWVVYCFLHSFFAAAGIKKKIEGSMGKRFVYYRPAYIIFAFLSLVALLWFQIHIPAHILFTKRLPTDIAGAAIAFSGVLLMAICIRKYFLQLSGIRSIVQKGATPELIITGVHKYVRHPLYLGTFAFIWGLFLLIPHLSLLIMDLVITIYTLIGIRFEEDKLILEFGEDYRRYQSRVPMLIPYAGK